MKAPVAPQKFVCATQASARRGSELNAPSIFHHPAREEVVSREMSKLPVKILPKPAPKKSESELLKQKMKEELSKLSLTPKVTPAKRIKGLIKPVDEAVPAYGDILKLLNSLK